MGIKIATHASDVDGVVSAALFLLKYPDVEVEFLKIGDLKHVQDVMYDFVIDLPKTKGAKVNIDHHESNYRMLVKNGLLSEADLVDPSAPSAATLVYRYLGLEEYKVAKELVEMAERADTGNHDEKLIRLDLVIKCMNGNQEKLLQIAKKLAVKGKRIFRDKDFLLEWKRIEPHYEKGEKIAAEIAKKAKKMGLRSIVVDLHSGFPRIAFGAIAHRFLSNSGKLIAILNRMEEEDPICPPSKSNSETERVTKISFRVAKDFDFDSRKIAEKLGGGGHKKASGCRVSVGETEKALGLIIKEFASKLGKVGYFIIDI